MTGMFPPRPYQLDCLDALAGCRRGKRKRALIVMASGLGKTVVSAHFARRLVGNTKKRVLFLVHQNDILAQAKETFEAVIGGPTDRFGFFHGREKNRRDVQFLFASFQTMKDCRGEFARDEFALVIVDEGHHGPAATYRPTIEYFTAEFLLGMTATPDRTDLVNIREIYGEEVFNLPLEEALARGLLTDVDYVLMTDELVARRLRGLQEIETSKGKLRLKDLNRLFAIPRRDKKVVQLIEQKIAERRIRNPRVVVFCPSIAYAEWLHNYLPGSVPIHSRLPFEVRTQRMLMYRSGSFRTALVVDQFNEGIDIPEANVIVFLRGTSSKIIFYQQLGRALRKIEGKEKALVLDLVGNCERLEVVRSLQQAVQNSRGPATGLEKVKVHFGLEFSETPKRILELFQGVRNRTGREQMIGDLQKLAKELGKTPGRREIDAASTKNQCAAANTYRAEFGSVYDAQKAAGLAPARVRPRKRSGSQLIAELKRLGKELGRIPGHPDIIAACKRGKCGSATRYIAEFGSIRGAQEAAGFELSAPRVQKRSRTEMLADLRRLGEELGRTPGSNDINEAAKQGKCAHASSYRRYFVSIQEAQRQANFSPTRARHRLPSRGELVADLKRLGKELGRPPSDTDVLTASKQGKCRSNSSYRKVFGTIQKARDAAGF